MMLFEPYRWSSPFETKDYDPVHLANGCFGGLLDLSGVTMDLWSSSITALPERPDPRRNGAAYPVTILRTQAFFSNAAHRREGVVLGRTGVLAAQSEYVEREDIPLLPQVYDCEQELDVQGGVVCTRGVIYPGTHTGLRAGFRKDWAVPFSTNVAFLKDSAVAGFLIECDGDTEIVFAPELILNERLIVSVGGKGIHRRGLGLDTRIELCQELLETKHRDGLIRYVVQPNRRDAYGVHIQAPGARSGELGGSPVLVARGRLFVTVTLTQGDERPGPLWTEEAFFASQGARWGDFWARSGVVLPESERIWNQRYQCSLFHVAQSLADGPTHPTGLSTPMLPHWYGCFHDTDTYFARPLLETGHFDEAHRHLRFRYRTLDAALALAAERSRKGALYPWIADPRGTGEVEAVPMNNAIIAVEAAHHRRYCADSTVKPLSDAIVRNVFIHMMSYVDDDGVRVQPVDSPVGTFSETLKVRRPSEVTLAIQAVAREYLETDDNDASLRDVARRIIAQFEPPIADDDRIAVADHNEPAFMRTSSVSLAAFPLEQLAPSPALAASLRRELGTTLALFSWLPYQISVVASRLGWKTPPTGAWYIARDADSYFKPFHQFDEWENRRTARAEVFVTSNGAFCTAIHAMLLAETARGRWELFPGIPEHWRDLSFERIYTRAGWWVSATMTAGSIVSCKAGPAGPDAAPTFRLRFPDGAETVYRAENGA